LRSGLKMNRWLVLSTVVFLAAAVSFVAAQEHYLEMQKIQEAINNGDFTLFKDISEDKVSVNFEAPFELKGYFYIERFIQDFNKRFSRFETKKIEWSSKQLEEKFAIQSLNLILKNRRSEKTVYYKFIFFMTKKNEEWKIYYLKGLKI